MRDIIEFILTVISCTVIGFTSHIWYLENIHTQDSDETIPSASVVNSSESFIAKTMRVTAYCPCSKCCGKYADGVTANGHKIMPGDVFVAAPKNIPFGTEMVVEGYNSGKPVKVLDRGGAITAGRLDVFFPTHKAALEWGVQNAVVIKLGIKT